MKKRMTAVLLALLAVLTACAAAPETDGEASETDPQVSAGTTDPAQTEPETEPVRFVPDVPAADFEGYAFRIGASSENNADYLHYTYTEEMNGEGVNDAVFAANTYVRDKYNIDIVWSDMGDSHFNTYQHIINSVHAGDDAYDSAILHDHASVTAMLEGVLLNLNELPAVDTSKPWWAAQFTTACTIGGQRLYFITGDASLTMLCNMATMYVNNNIYVQYFGPVSDLYSVVLEGGWTFDKMAEYCDSIYTLEEGLLVCQRHRVPEISADAGTRLLAGPETRLATCLVADNFLKQGACAIRSEAHLLHSGTDLRAETLQTYLLTSVRNRCINLLVHRQKEQQMQKAITVEMITPEQTAEQEQLQMLHHYIDSQLPKLSQQILRLRYQQGLKYREIADVLQVSEVTVHNHLSQSLQQLKDHFKSLGYGIK